MTDNEPSPKRLKTTKKKDRVVFIINAKALASATSVKRHIFSVAEFKVLPNGTLEFCAIGPLNMNGIRFCEPIQFVGGSKPSSTIRFAVPLRKSGGTAKTCFHKALQTCMTERTVTVEVKDDCVQIMARSESTGGLRVRAVDRVLVDDDEEDASRTDPRHFDVADSSQYSDMTISASAFKDMINYPKATIAVVRDKKRTHVFVMDGMNDDNLDAFPSTNDRDTIDSTQDDETANVRYDRLLRLWKEAKSATRPDVRMVYRETINPEVLKVFLASLQRSPVTLYIKKDSPIIVTYRTTNTSSISMWTNICDVE